MPTDIETSITDTGRRHFSVDPLLYPILEAQCAANRGWPDAYTERAIPPIELMPRDVIGRVLVSQERDRFSVGDNAMIAPFLGDQIVEITYDQYQAAKVVS